MVSRKTLFEVKRDLMNGNLSAWFILFLIIFIVCEVFHAFVLLGGGG